MKRLSVIIAHDQKRGNEDLNKTLLSVTHDLAAENWLYDSQVIIETEGSKSESRNKAVKRANGEILLFLDSDVILRRGFLRQIMDLFYYHSVGVVGGVNVSIPGENKWEEISSTLLSSPIFMFKSVARYTPRGRIRETNESEIIGCCMAIRKEAFLEAGGFPLDVIPCEENVLIDRIQENGWKIIYNPYAIVYHKRAEFPGKYARKIFGYGMGRGIMLRKMGSAKMVWRPRFRWIYYFAGFFLHYGSYFSGLIYGYMFKGKKGDKKE